MITKTSSAVTYAGATSAMYFGLTANEWAALGGLLVAVIGLAVTWYFQRKRDKREQAEFERRMGMYGE